VYKNPKKPKPRGASAMQPAAAAAMDPDATTLRYIRGGMSGFTVTDGSGTVNGKGTVNEAAFWKKKATEVPVNELFFHKFFMNKMDKEKEKAKKIAKRRKTQNEAEDTNVLPDDSNDDVEVPAADSDEAADSDGSEEAEIWKAMKRTMPGPQADLDLMEDDSDSDSLPSPMDGSDEEMPGSQISADDDSDDMEDETGSEEARDPHRIKDDESDEGRSEEESLVESDVDLIALSDVELPDAEDEPEPDLEALPSAFEPEDSEAVLGVRKPHPEDMRKGGRKKRRVGQLPTFASYNDYAKLIEEGPEDDI